MIINHKLFNFLMEYDQLIGELAKWAFFCMNMPKSKPKFQQRGYHWGLLAWRCGFEGDIKMTCLNIPMYLTWML
jgi:hypothetical protein